MHFFALRGYFRLCYHVVVSIVLSFPQDVQSRLCFEAILGGQNVYIVFVIEYNSLSFDYFVTVIIGNNKFMHIYI